MKIILFVEKRPMLFSTLLVALQITPFKRASLKLVCKTLNV